jgi:outer membrane protein OmpA-like peptidoglycan-associated protein
VQPLVWDGKDESGNVVADGNYSYRLASTDRAGNTTRVDVIGIRVDTVPTPIFVTISSDGFSPDGDGDRDSIDFFLYVNVSRGIESWQFSLQLGDTRQTVKSFSGTEIPRKITWDGRGDSGEIADGIYVGEFVVVYQNGNRPVEKSHPFRLDTSPPQVTIETEPTPFSPDNDGVDDDCIISLTVDDLSSISKWEIRIRDPKGIEFTRYSGSGKPAETIIWEGRADWGERVQGSWDYTLEITIQDEYRNSTTLEHKIPVDILVDKEGERLQIVISSFAFDGDTEKLVEGPEAGDKAENNRQTLEKLAAILKHYAGYNVLIESHENNTYWPDRVRAMQEESRLGPLSLKRAMSIKGELVRLGLDAERIVTMGLGGEKPVVPYGDRSNRWKNQRIEIILIEGKE